MEMACCVHVRMIYQILPVLGFENQCVALLIIWPIHLMATAPFPGIIVEEVVFLMLQLPSSVGAAFRCHPFNQLLMQWHQLLVIVHGPSVGGELSRDDCGHNVFLFHVPDVHDHAQHALLLARSERAILPLGLDVGTCNCRTSRSKVISATLSVVSFVGVRSGARVPALAIGATGWWRARSQNARANTNT